MGKWTLRPGTAVELATPPLLTFVNSFLRWITFLHFFALVLSQTCFYNWECISFSLYLLYFPFIALLCRTKPDQRAAMTSCPFWGLSWLPTCNTGESKWEQLHFWAGDLFGLATPMLQAHCDTLAHISLSSHKLVLTRHTPLLSPPNALALQ